MNCLNLLLNIFLLEHILIWHSPLPVHPHITKSNEDFSVFILLNLTSLSYKILSFFHLVLAYSLGFLSTWLVSLSQFYRYCRILFLSVFSFLSISLVISSRLVTVNTNCGVNPNCFICSPDLSSEFQTYIPN